MSPLKKVGVGLLLGVAAGLLYLRYSAERAPSARAATQKPPSQVTKLARQRTPASRAALVARYALRPDDRRAIANEILSTEKPMMAIEVLMAAVGQDKTPLAEDEMLDHLAHDMAPFFENDALFAEGRDLLRLAEHDKARALMAASLTARADVVPRGQGPISEQQKHELASDLIQVHMGSQNPDLRERTLRHVETIAGPDLAEVLADPENAAKSRLARRLEGDLGEARARAGVPREP
ncbi:MAG TPA: hypothetical protein VM686_40670 [Polyangiaceae bacterium]|nr:hypothetical protein [Polyangiaceae bacterium]